MGEFFGPIEGVDAVDLFFVEEVGLYLLVEVWSDEGVAAFDVGGEVGEGSFVEEF